MTFRPRRLTPLYRAHLALGARFAERHGVALPEAYTSAPEEARAARAGVGLADVGGGDAFSIRGTGLGQLLAKLGSPQLPDANIAAQVRLDGGEALVCRLAPDEALIFMDTGEAPSVRAMLEAAAAGVGCAHVTDLGAAFAAMEVIGPAVPALLGRLVPLDLSPRALPPRGCLQGELARVRALIIRLDHPRLPAFRLLVGREHGEFVWAALCAAGRDLGLVPLGRAGHGLLMTERA